MTFVEAVKGEPVSGSVLVANPGGLPWIGEMAAGLARAGLLDKYLAPFGNSTRAVRSIAWMPRSVRRTFETELKKRELPGCIEPLRVEHAAAPFELLSVASQRLSAPRSVQESLRRLKDREFDREVARRLTRRNTAVIGFQEAALATIRAAHRLGVCSFLDYPIAHYRFAESLLQEESRLRPDFAETLQFHRFPGTVRKRMDDEIDGADRIFMLSSFQRRTFVEAGIKESKLLLTPLGVDLNMFRPQPRTDDGVFRILFKGQVTQRKGIAYLIEAFQKAAIPNSQLVLAGRIVGTDKAWRDIPGITHVPHLPLRQQVAALYSKADVFAVPSLIDGFLLTGLEAMASGVPVILTPHTFGEDVVTDKSNGFLVPIRDSDSIADRLVALYKNPGLRAEMGRRARLTAEALSWERYGELVSSTVSESLFAAVGASR